jgi:hypothetical protein
MTALRESVQGDPVTQFLPFERQVREALGIRTPLVVNAADWMETEPPLTDPIMEETFDRGDKVAVIGSSKLRKSFFVLQMAMHLAAGMNFLGWTVGKPRRVLLVQLEVKDAHFHRRVRRMADALGLCREAVQDNLQIINGRGHDLALEDMADLAAPYHPDLIIFDPLYKLVTGDENAAEDMKPVLAAFDRLAEQTGAAILYVHHDAKGQAGDRNIRDRGAGSGVLGRDYDCCITLTAHRDDENAAVVGVLLRNYKPQESFSIGWMEGRFLTADLPVIPATSGGRSNPVSTKPAEDYIDQAVRLCETPMSTQAFCDALIAKVGLTNAKMRAVKEAVLQSGKLKQAEQRFARGAPLYIGKPSDIDALVDQLKQKKHTPAAAGIPF